jgi:hypothetical protein
MARDTGEENPSAIQVCLFGRPPGLDVFEHGRRMPDRIGCVLDRVRWTSSTVRLDVLAL